MSIAELPLWVQASIVLFLGGCFAVGLCVVSFVLDAFPSVYRFIVDHLFPDEGTRYDPEAYRDEVLALGPRYFLGPDGFLRFDPETEKWEAVDA